MAARTASVRSPSPLFLPLPAYICWCAALLLLHWYLTLCKWTDFLTCHRLYIQQNKMQQNSLGAVWFLLCAVLKEWFSDYCCKPHLYCLDQLVGAEKWYTQKVIKGWEHTNVFHIILLLLIRSKEMCPVSVYGIWLVWQSDSNALYFWVISY